MAESSSTSWDEEWEICNDNGFVFKRRLRRRQSPPPPSPKADSFEARRSRKKAVLLSLKLKYQQELDQWLHFSALPPTPPPTAVVPTLPPSPPRLTNPPRSTEIDDLILQVEVQEAVIRKLTELCDCVETVCDAAEERAAEVMAELPVWGSPRRLLGFLTRLLSLTS